MATKIMNFCSDLHLACSNDYLREQLNYIFVEDGYLIASDGHILIRQHLSLSFPNNPEYESFLQHKVIHRDLFKFLRANDCIAITAEEFRVPLFENVVRIGLKNADFPNKKNSNGWINYKHVFENHENKPVSRIGLNPGIINRLMKASGIGNMEFMEFYFDQENKGVKVLFSGLSPKKMHAVIMPCMNLRELSESKIDLENGKN